MSLILVFLSKFLMYIPSQNVPVLCIVHPLSHIPVVLLHGAPSLQTPRHLTQSRFETYVPSLQTVKSKQFKIYMNIMFMEDFKIVKMKKKSFFFFFSLSNTLYLLKDKFVI